MRGPQGWEWLVILAIVVLLFGYKRLPDAARGIGRSLRILKAETKGLHDDDSSTTVTPVPDTPALPGASPAPRVDVADPTPGVVSETPEPGRRPTN